MSKIQVNEIVNHFDNGAPDCPRGLTVTGVSTFSGNVSIGGTLTYEDVTNIDSVGVITARSGIDVGPTSGIGITLSTNGDSTFAGNIQSTSQNGGQLAGFRNLLINGDFRVWQRGTDFNPIAAGEYGADRWYYYGSDSSARFAESSDGSKNTNKVTGSTYTSNISNIQQGVELTNPGYNSQFSVGSVWTQSFYSDQNLEGVQVPNVRFRIGTGEAGYSGDWVTAANVTGVTWQRGSGPTLGNLDHYFFTFTITGDASGTTGTALSLGTAFPGDSSGVSVFTYCQLEPGPVATPFEHRPIGTELALCQRYFYKVTGQTSGGYTRQMLVCTTSSIAIYNYYLPVSMRVVPTMTSDNMVPSTIEVYNYTTSSARTFTSIAINESTNQNLQLTCSFGGTNNTPGDPMSWRFVGAPDAGLLFSAEL